MKKLKEKLEEEIAAKKDLEKLSKQVQISMTAEGLRIELIEEKEGTFYQSGSPKLSESGQELLALLGAELKTLPNGLLIEGHTDSTPYANDWATATGSFGGSRQLGSKAVAAGRRSLRQVSQVRGYADQFAREEQPYRSLQSERFDPGKERYRRRAANRRGAKAGARRFRHGGLHGKVSTRLRRQFWSTHPPNIATGDVFAPMTKDG